MRKIPCLFKRDPANRRRFLPEHAVTLPPDAVATVKWDGVAVERDVAGQWWVRHETKPGRRSFDTFHPPVWPRDFRFVEHDPTTGKDVGWVPLDLDNPDHELIGDIVLAVGHRCDPGTYEAVGRDHLVRHGHPADIVSCPTDFLGLTTWLFGRPYMEGVVWWDAGLTTPLAKVRRYDLGLSWHPISAGETLPGGVVPTPPPAFDDDHPPGVVDSPAEVVP